MRHCIYCKIKDTNSDVLFFELPKNKNLLELWYENMGFNLSLMQSDTKYLCSQHFTKDCIDFNNKVLQQDSVPTIFKKHMTSLVLINKHDQIINKMIDESNVAGPSSMKRSPRTCNSIYRKKTGCNKIQGSSTPRPKSRKNPMPSDFKSPAISRVCRICLDIDVKMYHMSRHNLSHIYKQVTGFMIHPEDKLPQMLCWECVARLSSANKFIEKAIKSQHMMAEIDGVITIGDIKAINRSKMQLKSSLGIFKINDTDSFYVEDIKEEIDDGNNDDQMVEIHDMNINDEAINIKDDISDNNRVFNIEIDCSVNNKPAIVNNNKVLTKSKKHLKKKKKLKPIKEVSVKIESVDVAVESVGNNELDNNKLEYPEISIINKEVIMEKPVETSVASTKIKTNKSNNVNCKVVKDKEIKNEVIANVNDGEDNEVEIFFTDHPEIIIINVDRGVSENNKEVEVKINNKLQKENIETEIYNDNEIHFESSDVGNEQIIGEEMVRCEDNIDNKSFNEPINNKDNIESNNQKREYSVNDDEQESKRIKLDDNETNKVIGDDSVNKLVNSTESDDLESNIFDIRNYEEIDDQELIIKKIMRAVNNKEGKSNDEDVVKEQTTPEDKDKSDLNPKKPPPLPDFNETRLTYVEQIQEIQNRKDSETFKSAKYKCDYCYKGFDEEDVYQVHMERHSKSNGKMGCFICKMRFKSGSGLMKHLLTLHVIKYSCKWCSFDTYQRSHAQKHSENHRGKIYKCQHCARTFHKLSTYQGHLRVKHVSDYVCELCGFTFVTSRGIKAHKYITHKYHDENTPLEGPHCDACDIKFLSQDAYTVHLKKSSKHTSNSELARTQNQREHKPRFSCELCDTMLNRDDYVQHYRQRHPDTSTLMCDQCGKMFNTLLLFKNHKCLYVDDLKQVVCDMCGLIFEKKIHLHVHRNRVHNHKGYKCKVCDKHFLTEDHRRRHVKYMHANHRAHKCDICLRFYKSRSNLKSHIAHTHMKVPWPRRTRPKQQK